MRRLMLLLIDLGLIALSTITALALRDNLELSTESVRRLLPHLSLTLAVAAPLLVVIGQDRQIWRLSGLADYVRLAIATLAIVIAATAVGFILSRLEGVARSLPILQAIIITCALVGARVVARQLHTRRQRDRTQKLTPGDAVPKQEYILVIGLNRVTELYLESVAEFAVDRIVVAGLLGRGAQHTGRLLQTQKILGTPREIGTVLQDLELHGILIDRIVITVPFDRLSDEGRDALLKVEASTGIELDFFAERTRIALPSLDYQARVPFAAQQRDVVPASTFVLDSEKIRLIGQRPYWRVKRFIDAAAAAVLILLVLPLILLVSLVVAFEVGLPVAFWQNRPGRYGRTFKVHKLRTMAAAYDDQRRRVPDELRQFPVGRFLRRTRLDELPQLFNILIGEMSFVGPRPLLPIDQPPGYSARLLVRPGLTGWAQVHGGRHVRAIDKAALDVWYVENASLRVDLKILIRTIPMVLFGEQPNEATIRQTWLDLQRAGIYEGPMPPI